MAVITDQAKGRLHTLHTHKSHRGPVTIGYWSSVLLTNPDNIIMPFITVLASTTVDLFLDSSEVV